MPPRLQFPDAEAAVKAWARTLGLVGNRVFLGLPVKASSYPVVVVQRVGGGPVGGDTPVDGALVQLEVWGSPPPTGERGGRDRYAVGDVANALAGEVSSIPGGTPMGSDAVCGGAEVTRSPVWSPDPDDGQSRYVLDALFALRKSA